MFSFADTVLNMLYYFFFTYFLRLISLISFCVSWSMTDKLCLLAKLVAFVSDNHILTVIEMINLPLIHIYGIKYDVIVNMFFINMSS